MPKHRLTLRFPMEAIAVLFLLLAPVSEASTAEPITYGNLAWIPIAGIRVRIS